MPLKMSARCFHYPAPGITVLSALLLCAFLPLPVKAQKAEAKRIAFGKGSSTALVAGTLNGRQQMEYALGARGSQVLWLQLAATPPGSLSLQLKSPEYEEMKLTSSGLHKWKAVLPRNGDYEVWVVREKGGDPVSTFKLRVTIH